MRIVLDTNVLIDGFSDDFSAQARLIDAVRDGEITALTTPQIEREYRLILSRLINDPIYRDRINDFLAKAEHVTPQHVDVTIEDSEDYKFLQAAVGGQADLLVSLDHHLLVVEEVEGVRILRPQEAWNVFEAENSNGDSTWQNFAKSIGIGVMIIGLCFSQVSRAAEQKPSDPVKQLQNNQQLITEKEQEIQALNKKIEALRQQRDTTVAEASIIDSQVKKLQQQIVKDELELKQISFGLQAVTEEEQTTQKNISELEQSLNEQRGRLRQLIRDLHEHEQQSLIDIFLSNFSLGDVLSQRTMYLDLQERTVHLMSEMRETEASLQAKQIDLQEQRQHLRHLQGALNTQQAELESQKAEQASFLKKKKDEQVSYEHVLKITQQARTEIEQQVFSLKNIGVQVKLNDAQDMARYASQVTGVRAALLMAVLKVESDVGNTLGNGKFPDDMHPSSREAFLRITKKLNLDPYNTPISARPRSYQGWGGAMGPGQFMAETWERIEERVAGLVKHTPNPYDLTDAFTATGMFLADKGATDRSKEYEAVNRYLAGPNWQRFTWYGDRVLAVAKEYEKNGL